jgi:hypothetical protein
MGVGLAVDFESSQFKADISRASKYEISRSK